MKKVSRRVALKTLAGGGLACAAGCTAAKAAAPQAEARPDAMGMLYDSTICTGCQACVPACARANGLEPDTRLSDGLWQMPIDLNSRTKNLIKLYQHPENPSEYAFFKHQCMHCLEPACVAACPFYALHKDKWGVVAWDGSKCIGCRYCEVACPFDVPRFEWDRFNPEIVKCELCLHRLHEGQEPGCTAACPTGAVIFGGRAALLARAKQRIAENPGRYYEDKVYGEFDGGGTQVLYLSHVPFTELGLPPLGHESEAVYATKVHAVLYQWMALPIVVYAGLAAIIHRRWTHHQAEAARIQEETGLPEQL